MTFIFVILVLLLIISITNNYLIYQKKSVIGSCPNKLIEKNPDETEYINISFFYKRKPYNKCYKNDLANNINSKEVTRYSGEMIINEMLNNLKNKYQDDIYYFINKENKSTINLSDNDLINIRNLSS